MDFFFSYFLNQKEEFSRLISNEKNRTDNPERLSVGYRRKQQQLEHQPSPKYQLTGSHPAGF